MGKKKRNIIGTDEVVKKCEALKPIVYDEELSAFDLNGDSDTFETKLVLDDYDWMHYVLTAHLPTKAYGNMEIQFEYDGAIFSIMAVKVRNKVYVLKFNTDIFQEHIIKFLQKQIQAWGDTRAFDGTEEAVNFYNAVLAASDTHLFPEREFNRAYYEERIDTKGVYLKKSSLFSDMSDESLKASLHDFDVFYENAIFPNGGELEQLRGKYKEMYGSHGIIMMEKDLLRECSKRWNEATE